MRAWAARSQVNTLGTRHVEIVTERLVLRPVRGGDLETVMALSADERVMSWLGGSLTAEQSSAWLDRQIRQWRDHGLGPFVVEHHDLSMGFVGLSRSDFDAGFVPGIEVAWRLVFEQWGKGYATEGARAVISHAFERLGLDEVIAVTVPENTRSRRVMYRLGMVYSPCDTFEHPRLPEGHPHRTHVVHRLSRDGWRNAR
jgi:RimJ/RimL family protein N-acetyltransferase